MIENTVQNWQSGIVISVLMTLNQFSFSPLNWLGFFIFNIADFEYNTTLLCKKRNQKIGVMFLFDFSH